MRIALPPTLLILALCTTLPAAPPRELDYIKRDTREATRRATMAQYEPTIMWGPWHLIGPFDNTGRDKFGIVFPPEIGVDLDATHNGKGGAALRWKMIDHSGWGPIDLKRFDDNEDGICYLYREAIAEEEAKVNFLMGSDDGLGFWINGQRLVNTDVYRGLDIGAHRLGVPFRAGVNTILVKVSQGVGGWDFQMRPATDGRLAAMLDYRLDKDFPLSPEAKHYRILTVIEPDDMVLEVGGLDVLPDGRPIIATRRGDVWIVDGAYEDPPFDCTFTRFARGLHEPLGLRVRDGAVLTTQRGELTRLLDADGDDRADAYETLCDGWGVSGNYHEFAFGPKIDGQGRLWVTLNLGFCGSLGKSIVPWRGWALIVNTDGSLTPVCGGLRSPNGLGRNADGDMFYTDNQGDWVGTNKLSHLDVGDYHGHPGGANRDGNRWYEQAGMPTPSEADFKPPAVWFPYGRMGQSASDILLDATGGGFGPFSDQLFVGDQTNATVMRVALERVEGVYQGACFAFRSGFDCGVNRLCFAPDGSMFVGMTNRGWGSLGRRPWGLQRLVYTGVEPFEILSMTVNPDGFRLTFTQTLDPDAAVALEGYTISSFTYHRHKEYGSPEIDRRELPIQSVRALADGRSVDLVVDGLRRGFVHELHASGVVNHAGEPLLHDTAYYTLNVIPTSGRP